MGVGDLDRPGLEETERDYTELDYTGPEHIGPASAGPDYTSRDCVDCAQVWRYGIHSYGDGGGGGSGVHCVGLDCHYMHVGEFYSSRGQH